MFIRLIQSLYPPDLLQELQFSGITPGGTEPDSLLSYPLILKTGDISTDQQNRLSELFRDTGIQFRDAGQPASPAVIAMLPGWHSVRALLSAAAELPPDFREKLTALNTAYHRNHWEYKIPHGVLSVDRPRIMGVLNITPDSFSDGGQYFDPDRACRHALELSEAGADIVDIGAESTRPGAETVELEEEWRRLRPVLSHLASRINTVLSVDTYKAEIASRALDEGADMINDISGLTFDPHMAEVVSRQGCPLVIMHIKGTPRNMQQNPSYDNLMEEIFIFFSRQIQYARERGIEQLIIDPGLGFGKRWGDNFEIIRRLGELRVLGYPILVGPSRKSFIGKTLKAPVSERLMGTAVAVAVSVINGARLLRVHDVKEMKQILEMIGQIYP